ncbi:GSCOCG00000632001-RA-CDS [Cotesia congregata]|nr:GSCOCG00000632001-RA-CDS [Cotesia congregata]
MEMKLPEQVHQVCRLCGQFESIYIDIFGEEGTRRLLGLKIHNKINIVIHETDPLPKTICVQCLGKLEFVCDFQEECLRTQQLLRDQYDVPSTIQDIEEKITVENLNIAESIVIPEPPSTSTNNINTDKNHNSTADIENVDPTREENFKDVIEPTEITTKPKRTTRTSPQTRSKNSDKDSHTNEDVVDEIPNRRWLRSRNITESRIKTRKKSKSKNISLKKVSSRTKSTLKEGVSIVTRLRSQNQNQNRVNSNSEAISEKTSNNSSASKTQEKVTDENGMIQIPTSALNKVLTAVSSSPEVEVSVKESSNRNGDIEDISFTLELRKKQETESTVTVLARVFPDQGSCLVGSEIINLLEDENNSELSQIINSIVKGKNSKDLPSTRTAELEELEKRLSSISDSGGGGIISSRNPEELFRIDGEEIRVDDNVESTTVDGQSGYSCKLCRKFYERRDKCTVHVKTHLGIKQYACTLCVAKFVCKSDVMKHIRCSHTNPRPMQCPKCPKRFRSKFDLTEHDNVHKGIKPYQCSDCGQSYHHKVSLQMHVKSHLPPQNLACEYCGKVFPFRTRLLSHIGSVHLKNRRNFRCRFCYNLYSSLAVLNDHIKTRHATTYTCEICSKTFKVASKYKAHVLQHSNPKPFVCNVCNNRYASKAFLNEHLLKHEGLRKHICQKCGASFAQASHLAAHRHVHGEKTHACPECGRKFNRRDNMKVHRKRHFAESGRIVTTDNKNQTGISDKSTASPASVDTDSNEK